MGMRNYIYTFMKLYICCFFVYSFPFLCLAQNEFASPVDSLSQLLTKAIPDTTKIKVLLGLSELYQKKDINKGIVYQAAAFDLMQKKQLNSYAISVMLSLADQYRSNGNFPKSIEILHQLLNIVPENHPERPTIYVFLAKNYAAITDYNNVLYFLKKAGQEHTTFVYKNPNDSIPIAYDTREFLNKPLDLAEVFEKLNQIDSAVCYIKLSYKRLSYVPESDEWKAIFHWRILHTYGHIKQRLGQDKEALTLYRRALVEAKKTDDDVNIQTVQFSLAHYFYTHRQIDSTVFYAKPAFEQGRKTPNLQVVQDAGFLLKSIYSQQNKPKEALYYLNIAVAAKDSLLNIDKLHEVQQLSVQQERRTQELADANTAQQNSLKLYILLGGLLLLGSVTLILYRNNRQKQVFNIQLEEQKMEIENLNTHLEKKVEERTAELQNALNEVQTAFNKGQTTERKRVSADLHDEIGSALSSIAIFSDMVKIKAQKVAPELANELDKIGTKSRDIIQNMRDTIWTLNEDSKQSLWERLYLSASESLNTKNISLDWQLPSDGELPEFPFNTKRNLLLIFKEVIINILKHADASLVTVESSNQNSRFILKITDNGKGFDASNAKKGGQGLNNFRNRMTEIGGKAVLNSQLGTGTTLVLQIDGSTYK